MRTAEQPGRTGSGPTLPPTCPCQRDPARHRCAVLLIWHRSQPPAILDLLGVDRPRPAVQIILQPGGQLGLAVILVHGLTRISGQVD